ncbi:hypothetical protein R6Q59_022332 [Mikania micrantha]
MDINYRREGEPHRLSLTPTISMLAADIGIGSKNTKQDNTQINKILRVFDKVS